MRVAHLSDVHLTASRSVRRAYGLRCRAVRFGRSADPSVRAQRLRSALDAVVATGADHLVISGDLTELGDDAEFERFAEVLADAAIGAENVTLVPGNHDAYTTADGWQRALAGPLAPWAPTSARPGPIAVVDRGDIVFAPIDVSRFQSVVRSGGELTREAAREIDAIASDPAMKRKIIVLVLHHPPFPKHDHAAWRLIDSLRGSEHVAALMARHRGLYLMHGHLHQVIDRERSFGAPGVADDGDVPRVRLYDVRDGALESAGLFSA